MSYPRGFSDSRRASDGSAGARAAVGAVLVMMFLSGCGGPSAEDSIGAAREALAEGNALDAVGLLAAAVEANPGDAETLYSYGVALIRNRQAALATWPLRRAIRDPEYGVSAGLMLARAYVETENGPDAERAATAVLELEPANMDARRIRARARVAAGDDEKALEDLAMLLAENPDQLTYREMILDAQIRLQRIDEAKATLAEMRAELAKQNITEPSAFAHLCVRDANLLRHEAKLDEAVAAFDACLDDSPKNREVLNHAIDLHKQRGDRQRELDLQRAAVEASPQDSGLLLQLALELRADGFDDEAETRLLEAAEEGKRPALWAILRDYYATIDDLPNALKMIDRSLAAEAGVSPGDEIPLDRIAPERLFETADLLIVAGEFERAEAVTKALEDEQYKQLLRARLLHKQGKAREALALWDDSFLRWTSNPGARYLAAQAAMEVDEWDAAIEHLRASVRAESGATDAGLLLARVYLAEGRSHAAQDILSHYLRGHPGDTKVHRLHATLCMGLGLPEHADASRLLLAKTPLGRALAISDTARETASREGAAAAIAYLDGTMSSHSGRPLSELVFTWNDIMLESGNAESAQTVIDDYLAAEPESSLGHLANGRLLVSFDQSDEAGAAFARAVELDPKNHRAHMLRARWLEERGQLAEAIAHYDLAHESEPFDLAPLYRSIELTGRVDGNSESETERLEALLALYPWEGRAAMRLADLVLEAGGDSARALGLATRASRFHASAGRDVWVTLGRAHLASGNPDRASEILLRAAERGVDTADAQLELGRALREADQVDAARKTLSGLIERGGADEPAREARQILSDLG